MLNPSFIATKGWALLMDMLGLDRMLVYGRLAYPTALSGTHCSDGSGVWRGQVGRNVTALGAQNGLKTSGVVFFHSQRFALVCMIFQWKITSRWKAVINFFLFWMCFDIILCMCDIFWYLCPVWLIIVKWKTYQCIQGFLKHHTLWYELPCRWSSWGVHVVL